MTERLNRVTLTNTKGVPVLTLYGVTISGAYVDSEAYFLRVPLKGIRVLVCREPLLRLKPLRLQYAGGEHESIIFEALTLERVE